MDRNYVYRQIVAKETGKEKDRERATDNTHKILWKRERQEET